MAAQSLYAATTTCCGLLGTAMMDLQPSTLSSDANLHAVALATGFSALQRGVEAFRETLEAWVARANGPLAEPQKAFGQLYVRFSRDLSR